MSTYMYLLLGVFNVVTDVQMIFTKKPDRMYIYIYYLNDMYVVEIWKLMVTVLYLSLFFKDSYLVLLFFVWPLLLITRFVFLHLCIHLLI